MKLKALYYYLFDKRKYHLYRKLCWIKAAKKCYINNSNVLGMCTAFFNTRPNIYLNKAIINVIPEFNFRYFNCIEYPYCYWWPIDDRLSRINAFNKLIKVYKNKLYENKKH